jgi:hypothetical protein
MKRPQKRLPAYRKRGPLHTEATAKEAYCITVVLLAKPIARYLKRLKATCNTFRPHVRS